MSSAVTRLGGRWSSSYAALTAGLLALAVLPVVFWSAEIWWGGLLGGAAAGLLALPISLILSWFAVRRPAWRRAAPERPGAAWALAALTLCMSAGLIGSRGDWDGLLAVGVVAPMAVWTWAWGSLGWGRARALTLPIFFGWFALPWEHFLRRALDIPLQIWTADVALLLLRLAGYAAHPWYGYTIYTSNYYVIVNETCSGMNMLVTLAMYTLIFGWIVQPSTRNRLLLLALAVPVAMLANGLRVSVILLLGHYGGREWANGFWHTGSAYLIFLPVFWFLYVVNGALTRRWVASRDVARRGRG